MSSTSPLGEPHGAPLDTPGCSEPPCHGCPLTPPGTEGGTLWGGPAHSPGGPLRPPGFPGPHPPRFPSPVRCLLRPPRLQRAWLPPVPPQNRTGAIPPGAPRPTLGAPRAPSGPVPEPNPALLRLGTGSAPLPPAVPTRCPGTHTAQQGADPQAGPHRAPPAPRARRGTSPGRARGCGAGAAAGRARGERQGYGAGNGRVPPARRGARNPGR